MPFDANQFVNAAQFGDASFYSGMDGQMRSITDAAKEAALTSATGMSMGEGGGVAPPETIGDFAQQRFDKAAAPVMQTYNKLSNTAEQLGQGNIANAYGAYKGTAPVSQTTGSSTGFDYSSNPFRKY